MARWLLLAIAATAVRAHGYKEALAKKLVLLADAAYCGDAEHGGAGGILEWTCDPCAAGAPLSHVSIFANASRATLGFAGVTDGWDEGQHIAVAFRGSVLRRNYVDDNDPVPLAHPGGRAGWGHRGVYESFASLKEGMLLQVRALLARFPGAKGLFVTGHSLGAGQAIFGADELAAAFPDVRVVLYTFGTPRVGDVTFVRRFAATPNLEAWAVAHRADTVPECGIDGNPSCVITQIAFEEIAYGACPDCSPDVLGRVAYHQLAHSVWYPADLATAGPAAGYVVCEGEDAHCENSVPSDLLNWDDHQLYLGHTMQCCDGGDHGTSGEGCSHPFHASSKAIVLYA